MVSSISQRLSRTASLQSRALAAKLIYAPFTQNSQQIQVHRCEGGHSPFPFPQRLTALISRRSAVSRRSLSGNRFVIGALFTSSGVAGGVRQELLTWAGAVSVTLVVFKDFIFSRLVKLNMQSGNTAALTAVMAPPGKEKDQLTMQCTGRNFVLDALDFPLEM